MPNIKLNRWLGHDLDLNALYYAQAANNTIHDITTEDISISAWVKVDSDKTAVGYIGGKFLSSNQGYGFYIHTSAVGNKIYLNINDGTDSYIINGNTALNDNKWHYVSAIIDRDKATNCKIFLDGYEDGVTVKVGTLANIDSITNTAIYAVGYRSDGSFILDGQIRDIKFYYAAGAHWTDAQILAQYNNPFCYDEAIVGILTDYWRCDEGSGLTLYGKVNNLTLSNALAWSTQPKVKMNPLITPKIKMDPLL